MSINDTLVHMNQQTSEPDSTLSHQAEQVNRTIDCANNYVISSGTRASCSLAIGDAWLCESTRFISISCSYGHIHMAIQ